MKLKILMAFGFIFLPCNLSKSMDLGTFFSSLIGRTEIEDIAESPTTGDLLDLAKTFISPSTNEEEITVEHTSRLGTCLGRTVSDALKTISHDPSAAESTAVFIQAVQPHIRQNISTTIQELKNEAMMKVKEFLHRTGKKVLIGGGAMGAAALIYYLLKKYTHPGSLNRDDLKKSNLIVESSGFTNGPISRFLSCFRSTKFLDPLILSPSILSKVEEVKQEFITVIQNLKNRSHNLKFNSLLLYGPHGTGKNLFIDHLIRFSNLEYLKIHSGTFIKVEDGAESKAIAALFRLLKNPKKEIVVVIEQADILFKRPIYKDKLMDLVGWIKANNHQFKLIVCAEDISSLDNDLLALMDDTLEFQLPGKKERTLFLKQRLINLLQNQGNTGLTRIMLNIFRHIKITEIARKTEGFSYARLEVLINQIKTKLLLLKDKITKEDMSHLIDGNLHVRSVLNP